MKRPNAYEVFDKELVLLRNTEIYQFVTKTLVYHVPDYFFYIPASVRGHHPPICRTKGGLVHHVKLAVRIAEELVHSLGIEPDMIEYSQIIAGTLLHDCWKRGISEVELWSFPDHITANRAHGRYAANQLCKIHGYSIATQDIIEAVKYHTGPWTYDITVAEKKKMRANPVIHAVHLADYMASRALHKFLAERCTDNTMSYLEEN
jgi:hypothetical protein